MRIILFYSGVESFNYFTNQLRKELNLRGVETYIWDLTRRLQQEEHTYQGMLKFCELGVDAVICFDCFGINEPTYVEFWDMLNICVVNIFMDPPFRFHPIMKNPPRKYIQFSPDYYHVNYIKSYFPRVEHVEFLPHAGTLPEKKPMPYKHRPFDLLFCGSYYSPEGYVDQMREQLKNEDLCSIFIGASEDLFVNSEKTVEQSVSDILVEKGIELNQDLFLSLMRCAEPLDWMVRMHYREKVIQTLLDSGLKISVIGRGWDNFPKKTGGRLNILGDRIPFEQTFCYMEQAKINLNVMPWFKNGTHDRIFNSMLLKSVCLTDASDWLCNQFVNGEDLMFYSLKELDHLPQQVNQILSNDVLAMEMVESGSRKVARQFVWKNCVDEILNKIVEYFSGE